MRELYEGAPYELMPEVLRTPENEAISYAVSEGLKKLLNYTKAISLYGDISQVSDEILDAMAAELRTQYYGFRCEPDCPGGDGKANLRMVYARRN